MSVGVPSLGQSVPLAIEVGDFGKLVSVGAIDLPDASEVFGRRIEFIRVIGQAWRGN